MKGWKAGVKKGGRRRKGREGEKGEDGEKKVDGRARATKMWLQDLWV